jgi:hypothetical protein
MAVMVRRSRVALSLLAIVGMLTSFTATCAAGVAESEQAQMACCKKMGHHKCGTPEKPADCCKTEGSQHEPQVTIVKADPLQHPTWTPAAWLAPLWLPALTPAIVPQVFADTSPPLRPDRPAYLRFSVLLI